MLSRLIVILVMIIILVNLFSGLYYLWHDQGKTNRTVKALTWRIGLSMGLFILLLVGFALGIIQPHGIAS